MISTNPWEKNNQDEDISSKESLLNKAGAGVLFGWFMFGIMGSKQVEMQRMQKVL